MNEIIQLRGREYKVGNTATSNYTLFTRNTIKIASKLKRQEKIPNATSNHRKAGMSVLSPKVGFTKSSTAENKGKIIRAHCIRIT